MADLDAAREFYLEVFGRRVVHTDDDAVAFGLGNVLVNLLIDTEAGELVHPGPGYLADAGSRFLLTVQVDDVDAVCGRLAQRGVHLQNGPQNRAWRIRTAAPPTRTANPGEITGQLGAGQRLTSCSIGQPVNPDVTMVRCRPRR